MSRSNALHSSRADGVRTEHGMREWPTWSHWISAMFAALLLDVNGACVKRWGSMNIRIKPAAFVVLILGCSDVGSSDNDGHVDVPFAATPLAGTVGGQPWSLVTAATDAFFSDGDEFWVDVYGEAIAEPCSGFVDATLPNIILNVPKELGEHRLGLTLTATFVLNDAADSNLVATQGVIMVDAVTESQITGSAFIEYDAQNTVNGRFTASICLE